MEKLRICINRNIVECKVKSIALPTFLHTRINRNIVECKDQGNWCVIISCRVLIETLWNVKDKTTVYVLVNFWSINRNIVECKFSITSAISCCEFTINRTIMECKSHRRNVLKSFTQQINRPHSGL